MLIWASSQWILRFAFLIMCRVLEHCSLVIFSFINIWSIPLSLFSIHDSPFLFVLVRIHTHTEACVQVFAHIMHMALEVPLELSTLFLQQHLLGFWALQLCLANLSISPRDSSLYLSSIDIVVIFHHVLCFMWMLGVEVRSSCLHGRQSTLLPELSPQSSICIVLPIIIAATIMNRNN